MRNRFIFRRAAAYLAAFAFTFSAVLPLFITDTEAVSTDTYSISDFEGENIGWNTGVNTDSVRVTEASTIFFGKTGHCLEVVGNMADANALRSTVFDLKTPINLIEYRDIVYSIYVPEIEGLTNATYYTRLTLFSKDGTANEHIETVDAGQWTKITADVGQWTGRGSVISAEIALTLDTDLQDKIYHNFYIDNLYADNKIDSEMASRFLFDSYKIYGGTAEVSSDKSMITVSSDGHSQMYIETEIYVPSFLSPANCLRLNIANKTENDKLTLYYSTEDSQANTEDKSITIDIKPNSEAQFYYAEIGDVSMVRSMGISLEKAGGSLEILSLSAIARTQPSNINAKGVITSAKVNDIFTEVVFCGEVNSKAALENQDGKIEIYRWNKSTMPTNQELESLSAVVSGAMTTRFELAMPIQSSSIDCVFDRYIAYIVSSDGEYILLAAPFYIENPELFAKTSSELNNNGKGFSAADISLVGDTDSKITVLDMDFLKAFTGKSESAPYIYNGEQYYFDGEYLSSLEEKIKTLSDVDVQVVLKFKNWSEKLQTELTEKYKNDPFVSFNKMATAPDGADYVGAVAAYCAKNWAAESVAAVIWGDCLNIIEPRVSLDDTTSKIAFEMRKIYNIFASENKGAKVYASVSDLYLADPATELTEYELVEFLPSLNNRISEIGDFNFGISIEKVERFTVLEEARYIESNTIDIIEDLLVLQPGTKKSVLFCDRTYSQASLRLGTATKNLAVGYYSALFNDNIDAYIVIAGNNGHIMSESIKYIDTAEASIVCDLAAAMLKIDSMAEIIDGWNESMLPKKRLSQGETEYTAPKGIKGRYHYYRFNSVSGLDGIGKGFYVRNMSISSSEEDSVELLLDSPIYYTDGYAGWLGFIHKFKVPENYKLTPILALTFKLEGIVPEDVGNIPVKLVLLGQNERFESSTEVSAGQWVTLYVDTSKFQQAESTECLQLLVGDRQLKNATMYIKSIDGLSFEYNDESLAEVINKSRLDRLEPDEKSELYTYILIGGAIVVVGATLAALILLSRKKPETDKN